MQQQLNTPEDLRAIRQAMDEGKNPMVETDVPRWEDQVGISRIVNRRVLEFEVLPTPAQVLGDLPLSEQAQEIVSHALSMGFVDEAQMIHVDHQKREAGPGLARLGQLLRKIDLELRAVGDAGEAVERGGFAGKLLGPFALGHLCSEVVLADDQQRQKCKRRDEDTGDDCIYPPISTLVAQRDYFMKEMNMNKDCN